MNSQHEQLLFQLVKKPRIPKYSIPLQHMEATAILAKHG